MPTRAQRDARNTRRRELRHLREDALRAQKSTNAGNSNPAVIPPIAFRPRGRPPRQISAEDRKHLRNARRQELRQIQRNNNTSMKGTHDATINLQDRIVDLPPSGSDVGQLNNVFQQNSVSHHPIMPSSSGIRDVASNDSSTFGIKNPTIFPTATFRRMGRPPRQISAQARRDLLNSRRRELRQIQRNNNANAQGGWRPGMKLHYIFSRTDNPIKNQCNSALKKRLEYYWRTGKLPPIQKATGPYTAQDKENLRDKLSIYCANSALKTNIMTPPETACVVSPNLHAESSKVAGQHDSTPAMHASVSDSHASFIVPTRESNGSDTVLVRDTPVIASVSPSHAPIDASLRDSDASDASDSCNSNGEVSRSEEANLNLCASNIHFLCYKPPQLEDLAMSGPSPLLRHCSGKQIMESFLKNAALSFSNTPSIIKRRREARTPLLLDAMQPNESRVNDGCDVREGSRFPESKFISTPCTSN